MSCGLGLNDCENFNLFLNLAYRDYTYRDELHAMQKKSIVQD